VKLSVISSVMQLVEEEPVVSVVVDEAGNGTQLSWKPTNPGRLENDWQKDVLSAPDNPELALPVTILRLVVVLGGSGLRVSVS
jgi:hypothetical protein